MANCINYNCDPLGNQTLNPDCGIELLGGISDVILLDCDHTITDPCNGAQVLANIASGQAILVENVKIGITAASPVTVDALIACNTARLVTYERSGTLIDGNVNANNVDFYNTLFGGRKLAGMILRECGQEDTAPQVTWIDSQVEFTGDRLIPDNNKEFQRFEGTFTWTSRSMPTIHCEPVGVFA